MNDSRSFCLDHIFCFAFVKFNYTSKLLKVSLVPLNNLLNIGYYFY